MNFELSDEQGMLVDAMSRAFAATGSAAPGRITPDRAVAHARWKQFGDLGLFDLPVDGEPGEFGTVIDWALVMEAAGAALVVEPLAASGLIARELLAAANSERANQMAGTIASGEAIVAICPAGMLDPARAVPAICTDGRWHIRADDCFALSTELADRYLLVAIDPQTKQPALFALARESGDTADTSNLIDGSWGGSVDLNDASAEHLGALSESLLQRVAVLARLMACAELVGVMTSAIAHVAPFLLTRVQFDKPLAEHQALQHQLADLVAMTDLARAYLHLALAKYQTGGAQQAATTVEQIYRVVGETAITAGERSIQLHGGMGMTEEHPIGRHLKRAMVLAAQF